MQRVISFASAFTLCASIRPLHLFCSFRRNVRITCPFHPYVARRLYLCTASAPSTPSASASLLKDEKLERFSMFDSKHTSFESLGISAEICTALHSAGISHPTQVQAAAIPRLICGLKKQIDYMRALHIAEKEHLQLLETQGISDLDTDYSELELKLPPPPMDDLDDVLMIGAETGSGKTLAYLLPFVEVLRQDPSAPVKAVILVPSRELCAQVSRFISDYVPSAPRTLVLAGGKPPDVDDVPQVRIIVATPAALLNHLNFSARIDKNDKYIVVDEADMLLSGSFRAQVEEVLSQPSMKPLSTRKNKQIRKRNRNRLVFIGATFPHWEGDRVKSVVNWARQRYPGMRIVHTDDIHRRSERLRSTWGYVSDEEERIEVLVKALESTPEGEKVMVFASSADSVQAARRATELSMGSMRIEEKFGGVVELHKKVPVVEREDALKKFFHGEARLLFCTDLASRGLDLGNVGRVIEYEFAGNVVAHLHRVGRTARAGSWGESFHFYDDVTKPLAEAIRSRDEANENVVQGVFSRNRSFRRKLKQREREAQQVVLENRDSTT